MQRTAELTKRYHLTPPRLIAGAVVALLLAGAGVAVSTDRSGSNDAGMSAVSDRRLAEPDSGSYAPVPSQDLAATSEGFDAGAAKAAGDARGGGSAAPGAMPPMGDLASLPAPAHDKIIKNASLEISVKKNGFRSAFDRVARTASELGGFVASSGSERVDGRMASGNLSLRVPADRFEEARGRLARIGKVEQESVGGQDVSGQLVDLEARLRSLRAQEETLRTLLARSKTVGEVIQVQEQLGNTRQQIEQLAAQQAHLTDQVAMATIQVAVHEEGVAVSPKPRGVLSDSLRRAVDGALAVVGGTIVVIGYAIPLALLAAAVWLLYRVANRRRSADGSSLIAHRGGDGDPSPVA